MKQLKIVEAYSIMHRFSKCNFKIRDAHAIYKLLRELEPAIQFQIEQEKLLFNSYNIKLDADNSIVFCNEITNEEKQQILNSVNERLGEIREYDNDIEYHPITLSYSAFDEVKITPDDIGALSGFITFTE